MSDEPTAYAASVTELRDGGRMLLLRTNVGCFRFRVPAEVARGILRITNPRCLGNGKNHQPAAQSSTD